MTDRYEYGVTCGVETYWPTWNNWLMHFRLGRWVLARNLAASMDADNIDPRCGKHQVVRRTGGTE
jgi:hypothetical protein